MGSSKQVRWNPLFQAAAPNTPQGRGAAVLKGAPRSLRLQVPGLPALVPSSRSSPVSAQVAR